MCIMCCYSFFQVYVKLVGRDILLALPRNRPHGISIGFPVSYWFGQVTWLCHIINPLSLSFCILFYYINQLIAEEKTSVLGGQGECIACFLKIIF